MRQSNLKPGLYAVKFKDNWDGDAVIEHVIATLNEDGIWIREENTKPLIQYKGDEVLQAWPLTSTEQIDKEQAFARHTIRAAYEVMLGFALNKDIRQHLHVESIESIAKRLNEMLPDGSGVSSLPTPRKGEADNSRTVYLIQYDDNDVRPEVLVGEHIARARFSQISNSWNAHLYVKLQSNSRDNELAQANYVCVCQKPGKEQTAEL